jgi:GntR family transcriptional repressor for pyruvate dehydrogenase complex
MGPRQAKRDVLMAPADESMDATSGESTGIAFQVERLQPSYVQMAAQLRALILSGQLALGERLPTEARLAAMFGVSRSTTREALRLLAAEKLVEPKRGPTGGTFVVHPDPDDIEATLGTALSLMVSTQQIDPEDVVEMWRAYEPAAARLAARKHKPEDAEELLQLSETPDPSTSDAELTIAALNFHRAVIAASGNRLLEMISRPLVRLGPERIAGPEPVRDFLQKVMAEHRAIAEAIIERDEDKAFNLMYAHFTIPPPSLGRDPERPRARRQRSVSS